MYVYVCVFSDDKIKISIGPPLETRQVEQTLQIGPTHTHTHTHTRVTQCVFCLRTKMPNVHPVSFESPLQILGASMGKKVEPTTRSY